VIINLFDDVEDLFNDELFEYVLYKNVLFEDVCFKDVLYKDVLLFKDELGVGKERCLDY
jgi:hypothetical protein